MARFRKGDSVMSSLALSDSTRARRKGSLPKGSAKRGWGDFMRGCGHGDGLQYSALGEEEVLSQAKVKETTRKLIGLHLRLLRLIAKSKAWPALHRLGTKRLSQFCTQPFDFI